MSYPHIETPRPLNPPIAQRYLEAEIANCVGGVISPLLANIYLSVLDRDFARSWDTDMSPAHRRQNRRRKGLPNYRLIRYADDFVVLMHGTKSDAEAIRQQIGQRLADNLKMTLSEEKTLITHLDAGFDFSASTPSGNAGETADRSCSPTRPSRRWRR